MEQAELQVLNELRSVTPHDDLEREHRDDAIAWMRTGAQVFRIAKPDHPPKHLVAYAVVVDPTTKKLLLVDHIKAQLWLPPGGHVDPGEHPRRAAARELEEEIGIEPRFSGDVSNPFFITQAKTVGLTAGHTDVSLWYVFEATETADLRPDLDEFHSVRWWSTQEVAAERPERFDPHMQRLVAKLFLRLS